jgi:hypothetical protein
MERQNSDLISLTFLLKNEKRLLSTERDGKMIMCENRRLKTAWNDIQLLGEKLQEIKEETG